jgi:hypothetical protein
MCFGTPMTNARIRCIFFQQAHDNSIFFIFHTPLPLTSLKVKLSGTSIYADAKDFSSNLYVQTSSEAHPDSYAMGKGVLSPGVKRGRGVALTIPPM